MYSGKSIVWRTQEEKKLKKFWGFNGFICDNVLFLIVCRKYFKIKFDERPLRGFFDVFLQR